MVLDGAEGEHRTDLSGGVELGLPRRAEAPRRAHVEEEGDHQLALLHETLYIRSAHARGDVPVDGANVVAGLVFAHLVELHPLSLEHAVVFAGEDVVHHAARRDLDAPHFFQDVDEAAIVGRASVTSRSGVRHGDQGTSM
jgi:hypothetical protein